MKEVPYICVTQQITEKKDKIYVRFMQTLTAEILQRHAENLSFSIG